MASGRAIRREAAYGGLLDRWTRTGADGVCRMIRWSRLNQFARVVFTARRLRSGVDVRLATRVRSPAAWLAPGNRGQRQCAWGKHTRAAGTWVADTSLKL